MSNASVEGNSSQRDVGIAFEKFLKEPWPLPDSLMSERKRLWCAFEAGAQFAIDSIRAAIPLRPRDALADEQESPRG